jgi:hypothetical protein
MYLFICCMNTACSIGKSIGHHPLGGKANIIMAEILLCNQPLRSDSIASIHGIRSDHITGIGGYRPSLLVPYRPYLYSAHPTAIDKSILTNLCHNSMPQDLTEMVFDLDGESVIAISEIAAGLRRYSLGTVGATTSIYANRMGAFAEAVLQYQEALLEYRDATKSSPIARAAAKKKVIAAYKNLQTRFQSEVAVLTSRANSRKGTVLGNSTRGLNIARSSRGSHLAKLNVLDRAQASNLMRFSQYGRYLGNGLVAIDFGSRIGKVHNSYQAGDNWERDLFIESSSFAAGAITASIAVSAGAVGLACLAIALTPPGWVLIIAGLGVAAVGATAAIHMDNLLKTNGGRWYDGLMEWMGAR